MSQSPSSSPPSLPESGQNVLALAREINRVTNAIQFALVGLVLALAYPTIRLALAGDKLAGLYGDMFRGRAVPPLTRLVFENHADVLGLAVGLPAMALAMVFVRPKWVGIYLLGGIATVSALFAVGLCQIYFDFGLELMKTIGSGAP